MNAFTYQSGEPTRVCSICKQAKPLDLMIKADNYKGGYRPECKACKNERQLVQRKKRKALMVKQVELEQAAKVEIPSLTPGRTFVPTGYYTPDKDSYYRNNGNKHIPSKGLRT